MAVRKDPRSIETAEPFRSLFPVEPETLALITASIREHGWDASKPILMWKDAFGERGRSVVVDGHSRLQAALDLGLDEIWATMRQFKDVDAAVTAGIGEQVIRRNLNREQIAAYVISILPMLDETKGGLRKRTAKQLADMLGVSKPTVDRARSLLDSGRDDLVEEVKRGELSLLAAWQESIDAPRGASNPGPARAVFEGDVTEEEWSEVVAAGQDVYDLYKASDPNPTSRGALDYVRTLEAAAKAAELAGEEPESERDRHLANAAEWLEIVESDDPERAAYAKAAAHLQAAKAADPSITDNPDFDRLQTILSLHGEAGDVHACPNCGHVHRHNPISGEAPDGS